MWGNPNIIAYASLLAWPVFAIVLFTFLRPAVACTVAFVYGDLMLPAFITFDAPVVPPLDKEALSGLGALIGCMFVAPHSIGRSPHVRVYRAIMGVMILGAFFTTITNMEPLRFGPTTLPGETLYDFLAGSIKMILRWWIPFYLGCTVIKSSEDLKDMMVVLVVAALVYSLLIWIEIRIGAVLNWKVYGYHQTDFVQTLRWGGFRPKVFMRHGLNVALFVTIALLASAALWRAKVRVFGFGAGLITFYLAIVLVACKSTGAIVYALALLPLVLFTKPRTQATAAFGLGAIEIGYPVLRTAGWIPTDSIVEFFRGLVGDERALSLWFRFETEKQILDRAMERMWFGWAGYQRPMIFDPVTGENTSIIDGYWAYEIGYHGLIGFFAVFGLLLLPVFRARKDVRTLADPRDRTMFAALALMMALYVLDLIPNSSIHAYLTFCTGALGGFVRNQRYENARYPEPVHGYAQA